MNDLYPIFIKLAGRPAVVVGGGEVALRKVETLLAAGARVTVVSPDLAPELEVLRRGERIRWVARRYERGDLAGAVLAFAAVDDRAVSAQVHRDAEEASVLLNAVDHDPHCSFHVPAVVSRGDLKVAISTGGKSPALASVLRERLEEEIGEDLVRGLAALGELRPRVLARYPDDPERRKRILVALARSVRLGPAPARKARAGIERGKVYLVGAGPGAGGLLTLRGAELIEAADEVHYDRLVGPEVLARIPPATPRVFVGKDVGAERPETGELLVRAARAGKAVVRLKGGDPGLFGRSGEEMLALLKAGVPFETVPGVSALNAVPAAAGIPLTCRGLSREVVVRSGYRREEPFGPRLIPGETEGTTYVYLMTIGRLPEIVRELRQEGVEGGTPAAIVERGTLPGQRVVVATLDDLVERAERENVRPPALLVVGAVVRFVNWKEWLPLLEAYLVGGGAALGE